MFDIKDYELREPNQILSPCLLAYPQLIRENLAEMIRLAGSPARLRPHVKTNKTPQIVHMALEAGITKHKCATLAEASMLAECGAPDVLVAYPQVGPAIARFASIVAQFPQTRFTTLIDDPQNLKQLQAEFERSGQRIDVLLDVDCGMHRTGIECGPAALELYREIHASTALEAAGFHVYDGHNHQPDLGERRQAVAGLFPPVLEMVRQLQALAVPVPKLVCGGTPTFTVFAELTPPEDAPDIECSPGTCVLSDFGYSRDCSELTGIRPAAVLMTRVISCNYPGRVTVDLGYKAVASDQPAGSRCHFLNLPEAREVQHSEEHLVLEAPGADRLKVGDVLYALPQHVCPTVALHSHLHIVEQGKIVDHWKVQARDRLY